MTTGEKIKKLRTEKMMTQSELVGNHITRNMLSRIESDEANPSLGTLIYLASRLNVPAGYLISDEKEDERYAKSFAIENIKLAYKSGDYDICRQLCIDFNGDDDEVALLWVLSCFAIAEEEFHKGKLKRAAMYFDEAISEAESTKYYAGNIVAASCVYFRYMRKFSPNLSSGVIDENTVEHFCAMDNIFCQYIYALECLHNLQTDFAVSYVKKGEASDPTVLHLDARVDMMHSNYRLAITKLEEILNNNRELSCPVLYDVFSDLEECTKTIGDFRSAYEYSNARMNLLQSMLEDNE